MLKNHKLIYVHSKLFFLIQKKILTYLSTAGDILIYVVLDTINIHNLTVPFFKKKYQRVEITKFIRFTVDHLQCWST